MEGTVHCRRKAGLYVTLLRPRIETADLYTYCGMYDNTFKVSNGRSAFG
jgi:hypothetical protein